MAVQFGIVTTATGVGEVILQSMTSNDSVQTAQALDEFGNIVAINGYSRATSGSMQVLLNGEVSVKSGDNISVGSDSMIVTGVDKSETNTGYAEATISFEGAPGVTPEGPQGGQST